MICIKHLATRSRTRDSFLNILPCVVHLCTSQLITHLVNNSKRPKNELYFTFSCIHVFFFSLLLYRNVSNHIPSIIVFTIKDFTAAANNFFLRIYNGYPDTTFLGVSKPCSRPMVSTWTCQKMFEWNYEVVLLSRCIILTRFSFFFLSFITLAVFWTLSISCLTGHKKNTN